MRPVLGSLLLTVVLLAAGCSTHAPRSVSPEGGDVYRPGPGGNALGDVQPRYRDQAELLYEILVGELAGYEHKLELSIEHYLKAARRSPDPAVAERGARIALFAKDYVHGVQLAERWVELAPDDVNARRNLAAAYLRNDQPDAALEQLDMIVRSAGEDTQRGFYLVTRLLSREDDQEAALAAMSRLVQRHSTDPYAMYAYAQLAAQFGDLDLARALAEEALDLRPGWPDASLLHARILVQQGNIDQALNGLAAVVRAHPEVGQLRLSYGRLLAEVERYDEAREQFEILLEQSPDDADLLYTIAVLAAESRRYDMAEDYLKRLIDTGQRLDDAHYYLGVIAESRGKHKQAVEWYSKVGRGERFVDARVRAASLVAEQGDLEGARRRLRELRPYSGDEEFTVRLYVAEADILRRAGRYQEALKVVNEALATMPDNNDLLYARAMVAEKLDRLDLLERDLSQILARDPENAHALNALGYTLADRTQRYQEALEYIERALELSPDEAAILDSMGWVHYRLGNLEKALTYLRRAYQRDQDPEIAAHLGEVLWVSGQREAAREVWDQALERDPDSDIVRNTIKRLQQ
ncbi:MAG: tetratricopeptide repeat protein [Gammaproteobacteria bacterium]|nr:tetratricopeptide repeat protein [Gammaproteobacteria bacterium]NIR98647.1 tetratricopeptide repeat protein [Gammaproteobacteria bacterium]NIT64364.1 tetratricopeptide repeat protein [Gammaproteobacteria bacterium]NIV21296.1 tetratricopeptide repeat protein [Gammaproteobacteria bacterium]NIY32944.1 tetratricopeptide repeat protein [Gammaproteobacteria bacterium]